MPLNTNLFFSFPFMEVIMPTLRLLRLLENFVDLNFPLRKTVVQISRFLPI